MPTPEVRERDPRRRKPLILGTLRGAGERSPQGFTTRERVAVRTASREGRDVAERSLDGVVDKLLKELSW